MKPDITLPIFVSVLLIPIGAMASTTSGADAPLSILAIFAGGLLTAFTPCVYPVIPLVLAQAGRGGSHRERTKKAALAHAALLVGGMTFTYTLLGVIAGIGNIFFGSWTSSSIFTVVATGLMWFFAMGMLGVYRFQMPHRLTAWAGKQGTHGYGGAFVTGALSGVLSAGCTGPVLAGILTYIAASQDAFQAVALMFTFSVGMGVPFFILSLTASALPRPGRWMIWVEGGLGVILVGTGAWFLTRSGAISSALLEMDIPAYWWLSGGILVVPATAFWIGRHISGTQALSRRTNILIVAAITAGMISFWTGVHAYSSAKNSALDWKTVTSEPSFLTEVAAHRGKLIFIDFHADWCGDCVEMENEVLHQPDIAALLSSEFISIRVDATKNIETVKPIARRFGAQGVPSFRFLDKNGNELPELRSDGPLSRSGFKALLKKAISDRNG